MYCEKCGAPANPNFCTQCGNPVPLTLPKKEQEPQQENENYTINKNYKGNVPPIYSSEEQNKTQQKPTDSAFNTGFSNAQSASQNDAQQPPKNANTSPFGSSYNQNTTSEQNQNQQYTNNGYHSGEQYAPYKTPFQNSGYGPQNQYNSYNYNYQTPYNNMGYNNYAAPKEKLIALILCVIFGIFGVHRFYVGKFGTGLLYLFTGGLFGIGYVVDIVLILCNSFTDSYGRPLI